MKIRIIFLAFALGVFAFWYYAHHPLTSAITIHNHKIFVELAITDEEKRKGLSNRNPLPPDGGMLFLMGQLAYHGFWMKGMRFPLDFIWIRDKTVVDLTENVPNPIDDEAPVSLKPHAPADKVLEVNAGTIAADQISIGDPVSFKN
ncbi:DUF192 domain-containing protein [Candidatus Gottesmanbacteria bacterium]|nr:DUF192 domain-containing protein [Candidatus Gottesmanbacteria bacterium]